jgi:hypothetical protein
MLKKSNKQEERVEQAEKGKKKHKTGSMKCWNSYKKSHTGKRKARITRGKSQTEKARSTRRTVRQAE